MQQVSEDKPRRDPAPSRLAFRLQRLWLTPSFRRLLSAWLPGFSALSFIVWVLASSGLQEAIRGHVAELRRSIAERPEFMVESLAVRGADAELSEDIRQALPLEFPANSFDLDLNEIKSAVEALDAVATADVHIRLGDILHVEVSERIPVVVWRRSDSIELLDAEGYRVAALAARAERADLPLIAGEGANGAVPEALGLFAAAGPLASRLRGLVRVGERRWDVVLDRGQRILLPEGLPVPALEQIVALDQARDLLGRDLISVDMRQAGLPTLRLTKQAAGERRRIAALESGGADP